MPEYGSYAQQPPNLIAGARCLDFLNTIEDARTERLTDYGEFAFWSKAAGVVDATGLRRLLALAVKQPQAAAGALAVVLEARQALALLLAGSAAQRKAAISVFNRILAPDGFTLRLAFGSGGFRELWEPDCPELLQPLLILLREAATLLSSPERAQVHHCADDDCHWFFLDASRNQSRRW